jgi:hypothetical protein
VGLSLTPSPVARSWRLFYAMYEVLAINQRQQCNDALSHAIAFSKLSTDQIRVTAPASRIHVHPLSCPLGTPRDNVSIERPIGQPYCMLMLSRRVGELVVHSGCCVVPY